MATESGRATDTVAAALQREPWRFEFFQAVRLLEALSYHATGVKQAERAAPVGYGRAPAQELVRFRSVLSRSFPSSEITRVTLASEADDSAAEMQVAFIGLTGPQGVLPEHYLDLLYRQARNRDYALRDFFDLFNHRTVSLFYRAWEKYRPAVAYERAQRGGGVDPFNSVLACLVGMGTSGQSDRLAFGDQGVSAYAGHFAHGPRSAWVLQTLLADFFRVPVRIEQFVGRWLELEPEQCTRLPGADCAVGQFNRLGSETVLGRRAWDEQGKFRVRVGPVSYARFLRFLPDPEDPRSALDALLDLTRMYAGIDRDFDVRLVLRSDQVPGLTLGGGAADFEPRLGWNTWLGDAAGLGDRDEALFGPTRATVDAAVNAG